MALAGLDTEIITGGFLVAYWFRFHLPFFPPPPEADFWTYFRFSLVIGFVTPYAAGMYLQKRPHYRDRF